MLEPIARAETRRRRAVLQPIHDPANAGFDDWCAEVDEEAQAIVEQAKVGEELL